MTNYTRGRAFEYAVMRNLAGNGFVCSRSAGSHGPYDIHGIALAGDGTTIYVQCKIDGRISPHDRSTLCNLAALACGHPLLASRAGGRIVYQLLTENGVRMEISPSELSSIGLADDGEDGETPKETEA